MRPRLYTATICASFISSLLGTPAPTAAAASGPGGGEVYFHQPVFPGTGVTVRPPAIRVDNHDVLADLRWGDWGKPKVTAKGIAQIATCLPACAAPDYVKVKVRVTATSIRRCPVHTVDETGEQTATYRVYNDVRFRFVRRAPGPPRVREQWRRTVRLPHPCEALPYTALGDSFSSGEGNPGFDEKTDRPKTKEHGANRCHRSEEAAYPRLLKSESEEPLGRPNFWACSGAEIADMTTPPGGGHAGQPAQLATIREGKDRVVTLTLGGNDVNFPQIVKVCAVVGDCRSLFGRDAVMSKFRVIDGLDLATVYRTIRARMHPDGFLFVAGYPHFFYDAYRNDCVAFFSSDDQRLINELIDYGDQKIIDAVNSLNDEHVRFVDVRPQPFFGRHEICSPWPWLRSFDPAGPATFSFHPTPSGQRAYARAFAADFEAVGGLSG